VAKSARAQRPFKPFLYGFLLLLLAAAGSAVALLYRELSTSLPPVARLLDYRPPMATRVLAADGSLIGELFLEKRYLTPIYRIPKSVQLAFVAAEDAGFFEHRGVDPVGIFRAALNNYRAGATRQGGSTITQQVVKALLLSPERSYERKLKEAILAVRLEQQLTKEEILYLYLNQIFLGNGAHGVQAAALEYFGKDVSALTLGEAAMLAGLPQAPSRYSPARHFRRAKTRQRYVLERMVEEGFVSREDAERAAAEPILLAPHRPAITGPAPFFVQHVRRILEQRYGARGPYELGLTVYTTLDLGMQRAAERALRAGVARVDEQQGFRGPLRKLSAAERKTVARAAAADVGDDTPAPLPDLGSLLEVVVVAGPDGRVRRPDGGLAVRWAGGNAVLSRAALAWATKDGYQPAVGDVLEARVAARDGGRSELELSGGNGTQGAMVALVPATGDVRAMVGGVEFGQSQFNRVTQAYRQPGSAFKPLIYAAAIDRGFTPASIIIDAPVSYNMGSGRVWSPQNFEKRYFGPTTLRDALTFSRNVVTVKLVQAMGLRYLIDYLPRYGFERPFPRNLSIALGTAEVTLLEMARGFAVFPNLGIRTEPRFITRITDAQGEVLEDFAVKSERVMSPDTAYLMVSMLESVVTRGTGRRVADLGRPVGGKTGTTNDLRDAWFLGFTPELLAGVWVGYDQDKTLGEKQTGGRAAAPIWRDFMGEVLEGRPVTDFAVPPEVVLVNIDRRSGLRASTGTSRPLLEAFKRGSEPTMVSAEPAEPAEPSQPTEPGVRAGAEDPDAATLRRVHGPGAERSGRDADATLTDAEDPSDGF
jgi:penicillin-binding protein 1A